MEISNIKQTKVLIAGKYIGYLHSWEAGKAVIECGQDVPKGVIDTYPHLRGECVILNTNQFIIDRSIQTVKK
jgi:hypothetical protein